MTDPPQTQYAWRVKGRPDPLLYFAGIPNGTTAASFRRRSGGHVAAASARSRCRRPPSPATPRGVHSGQAVPPWLEAFRLRAREGRIAKKNGVGRILG